ncbi:hypothetical protein [Salinivibrio kushneri]|uniref:Copper resistance protein n=1 Tax=Salinivibrio kushneri TaxID=1908198 RepID=A0AB36K9K1_9GAMM|nr:hypothetical protein [Salinivibrio kushneri]OOE38820.1 hypothetical protein BZG00_12505 [Salinivibrio kushneri]OOE44929.1 hypothetical protein BZG06_08540 [Salinivibrio kushneri]OOE46584.1 hypothetical protein BZG09_00365 [Salinivibrio kushneri]OOE54077.1 hypothetical protein BZG11_00865 [Salinivibrio kushneri]OOE54891.1 hypothetical protein BZG10_03395 [Salinivibrio kushneri]
MQRYTRRSKAGWALAIALWVLAVCALQNQLSWQSGAQAVCQAVSIGDAEDAKSALGKKCSLSEQLMHPSALALDWLPSPLWWLIVLLAVMATVSVSITLPTHDPPTYRRRHLCFCVFRE